MIQRFSRFKLEFEHKIAVVTMIRSEKKNALDMKTIEELESICRLLNSSSEINVAVLTGENGVFSAGGDITEWGELSPDQFSNTWLREGNRTFDALAQLRQPLIAVLNGVTYGGGLELAACADLRIAETTCKLGQPETSIGVVAGWSGTQRLVRRFGAQPVRRMLLCGEIFSAKDAKLLGLVDFVVPVGEGLFYAKTIANKLCARSPIASQVAKCMVNAAEREGAENAIDMLAGRLVTSEDDVIEGISAFKEKRAPRY